MLCENNEDMYSELLAYFGVSVSLLIGLSQIFHLHRMQNFTLFLLFIVLAILQSISTLFVARSLHNFIHLFLVQLPLMYCVGPLVFLYKKALDEEQIKIDRMFLVHFIPAALVLIWLTPFFTLPAAAKVQLLQYSYDTNAIYPTAEFGGYPFQSAILGRYGLMLIDFGSVVNILIYIVILMVATRKKIKKTVWSVDPNFFFLVWLGVFFLALLVMVYGLIINQFILGELLVYATSLNFLAMYILGLRYPLLLLRSEEKADTLPEEKYKKSRLVGVDTAAVADKLADCMRRERVFTDNELTLAKLAEMIELSPHQLSEYFNSILKTNFRRYINQIRIAEAKKQLIAAPHQTTVYIGLQVGFNSDSYFNTVFLNEVGMPPGRYRKKMLLKTQSGE